jgi:hypothetical protein
MEMNKNQENSQAETEILNTSKENTNAPPVTQVKTDKKCLSKFRGTREKKNGCFNALKCQL